MKNIVVVSGGFDPIHSGHIAYFKAAKALGDQLVVGVNSDEWLIRKKGKAFMPIHERQAVVQSIKYVDYVIRFDDNDDSAIMLLKIIKQTWPNDNIIFANGGDRNESNNREISVKDVEFVYGVGGSMKLNSSSKILHDWLI
jgi:D-beta-D-heptose 7-phosphate kinase/D-beta-D-heptose 1-phosphate adenosyltransferase